MSAKKKLYEVNDRVFAKVRGFPAWPARIMEVANASGSRYKVFFFGTYETATLKKEEIWEYNASSIAKFGKGNQKRKGFAEGMYEIENMPDLKTAEAIEEEEGGSSSKATLETGAKADESENAQQPEEEEEPEEEPMETEEALPPVRTPRERASSTGKERLAAGNKEKTPVASKATPVSSSSKERPKRDRTPAAGRERTPVTRERTMSTRGLPKEKNTPVSTTTTKDKDTKTPLVMKEETKKESKEAVVPAEEEPLSPKKEAEVEEEKVPSPTPPTNNTPDEEEEEIDSEVPPKEAESKKEEDVSKEQKPDVKEEEEDNNEVSSSLSPTEESEEVKSTPADTTSEAPTTSSTTEDEVANKEVAAEEEEEEPVENALVINETTPVARTRNNRSSHKRKAEEITPSGPPPAKKKNAPPPLNVTPSEPPSASPCATVSRSGRIIKPKKFVDDDDDVKPTVVDTTPSHPPPPPPAAAAVPASAEPVVTSTQNPPAPATTTKPAPKQKEPRKMWVEIKSTGDVIEINLDQDKPSVFESKEAELQWEKTTARNALKFKERVESGDFIPDEVRLKLEAKLDRSEEEEKILKKAKMNSLKMERIRWLKIEQKIIDLDIQLKSSCRTSKPDLASTVVALREFDSMTLAPLMLKKQPSIVHSVGKLRAYVGPKVDPQGYEEDAEKIRLKADKIYAKLKAVFEVPEETDFEEFFREELNDFRAATKSMEKEKLLTLVSDPTKKAKKKK